MIAGGRSAGYRHDFIEIFFGLLLLLCLGALIAANDEAWFADDAEGNASAVNEGHLRFIKPRPGESILHSDTRIWLSVVSLRAGWAEMQQCYRNLDAVSRAAVVYAYAAMRELRVTRAEKMARYRIFSDRVELEEVDHDAVLCVSAEVNVL